MFKAKQSAGDGWLIIGLGNPGDNYEKTRHNLGYMVVDELARRMGVTLKSHRAHAFAAEGRLGVQPGGAPGGKVILGRGKCYMNQSGGPTKALQQFFQIDPEERLLVVHDDIDLPEYELRLKKGGGEGGHNGLRSISSALGTKNYCRFRIGAGRPAHPGQTPADYVLSPLSRRAQADWQLVIDQAADTVERLVNSDFRTTQQYLHSQH